MGAQSSSSLPVDSQSFPSTLQWILLHTHTHNERKLSDLHIHTHNERKLSDLHTHIHNERKLSDPLTYKSHHCRGGCHTRGRLPHKREAATQEGGCHTRGRLPHKREAATQEGGCHTHNILGLVLVWLCAWLGYMTIHRVTAPKLCGVSLEIWMVSTVAPTTPPMNRTAPDTEQE